ncbi:MAG: response regulator transcription factor [Cellulosilyticum sp.]|nr:response regulator transcription factor [Cellulosilyticum sp.]
MIKILLVEDEIRMQEVIVDYFKIKDIEVTCANNGVEALERLEENSYDLVLLDIMMPKLDGFSVCRAIRKNKQTMPIIFLTAKIDESNQLLGYELGADDYMTKPFSLVVLYAKSMALIKRAQGKVIEDCLQAGNIQMFSSERKVYVAEKEIKLPHLEYRLLEYFLHHKNQVVSREEILVKLWGYDFEGDERILDNHMKKLRKALGKSGKCIHTIRKVGYRLEAED